MSFVIPVSKLQWQMAFLQQQLDNDIKCIRRWEQRLVEATTEHKQAEINKANTERAILQLLEVYNEH